MTVFRTRDAQHGDAHIATSVYFGQVLLAQARCALCVMITHREYELAVPHIW